MPEEATTPDMVELTRRAFASANGGDYDAMASFYAPDAVFDMSAWGLGIHVGRAAVRSFLEDWIGAFDDFEMELEEVLDLGNGAVFAVARQRSRPAGSKSYLELRHAAIYTWVAGLAARAINYRDLDEARAAAKRLAEEPG
jgi:ketosteroid isomerase-like protein